jgi:hypothetical protein
MGIVAIGHSTLGHVAATFVDLAHQGLISLNELDEGESRDWELVRRPSRPRPDRDVIAFEMTLLELLPVEGRPERLQELRAVLGKALRRFRDACRDDAVHRGWFGHLHRERLTDRGEALAEEIRLFRMALLRLTVAAAGASVGDLDPYAMALGQHSSDSEKTTRFVADLVEMCHELPDWKPSPIPKKEFSDSPILSSNTVATSPINILMMGSGL